MTVVNLFECNVSGYRFGAKNDVVEFDIIRQRSGYPFETYNETVHISLDVLDENGFMYPSGVEYVAVERDEESEEIVGMKADLGSTGGHEYFERDSVLIDHYESFFRFVEEEMLY
ncbi:hypothetical protein [Natrinema sp. DC36]|uniref:hypothetical protein n=1 Tax=Natrinema sp. DC36 TaxID=2878680 RepID=UPI001CEFE45F|nr:hypothetical protein [Natrinema sp. DC36]